MPVLKGILDDIILYLSVYSSLLRHPSVCVIGCSHRAIDIKSQSLGKSIFLARL